MSLLQASYTDFLKHVNTESFTEPIKYFILFFAVGASAGKFWTNEAYRLMH
jgi:hypothetical protein